MWLRGRNITFWVDHDWQVMAEARGEVENELDVNRRCTGLHRSGCARNMEAGLVLRIRVRWMACAYLLADGDPAWLVSAA